MLTAAQNQLQRTTPEQQGIASAAIIGFVEAVEEQIHDLHSFILVRHGNVVAEGWWSPYASDRPHMLFSLSKSFTSSAIGLAVMEGRLSVDDTVLSFFPDEDSAAGGCESGGDEGSSSAIDVNRACRRYYDPAP